jgi:hypothetical protein
MEVGDLPETFLTCYQSTRPHIPENSNFQFNRNLISFLISKSEFILVIIWQTECVCGSVWKLLDHVRSVM